MPYCLIESCPNRKGKPESGEKFIFHGFPTAIENIRQWLTNTGQQFNDLEAVAQKILEGKDTDVFRICSTHFEQQCYKITSKNKTLQKGSEPTIFLPCPNNIYINEDQVLNFRRRKQKSKNKGECSSTCTLCGNAMPTAKNICSNDASSQTDVITTESSTQTEDLDSSDSSTISLFSDISFSQTSEQAYHLLQLSPQEATESQQQPPTIILLPENHIKGESSTLRKRRRSTTEGEDTAPKTKHQVREQINVSEEIEKSTSLKEKYFPSTHIEDPPDVTLHPFMDGLLSTIDKDNPDFIANVTKMRKFLVFESCLDELISKVKCQHSPFCHQKIVKINKQLRGSAVIVRGVCEGGHRFKIFESQPKIKRHYSGNVLLAAGIVCSGANFTKTYHLLRLLGVSQIRKETFFHYKKQFCFPAINLTWETERKKNLREARGKPITLAGDGQCDSPGHSAKYCIYSLMDIVTHKIIDFEVVQSTQCSSSIAMEKLGFDICMTRVIAEGLDIILFASDKHEGIRKMMREKYGHIIHQFDVWHYAKNISKKIRTASQKKINKSLIPWIDKIYNHFWWSVQHCENNEDKLKKLWLSLLHHVVNEHEWIKNGNLEKCDHNPITDTEHYLGFWLHKNSPAYDRLEAIVNHHQILADLKNLIWSCHTGPLKVFHSNVIKYRTKRIHYGMDSMKARTVLAALSNNHNVGRKQAVVKKQHKNSAPRGSKRYRFVAPTGKKKLVTRKVYDPKLYTFIGPILEDTLRACQGTLLTSWVSSTSTLPQNIASLPRPDTQEIIQIMQSRFGSNSLL
ncbi:uncharacterized protein [Hyperolius riggenbachi]|uniref:uncharacterized protein isoform X2 n=1 Tax=Hyperolius riggenbachi TaxID=752182 RepID=UPI0035A3A877